MSPVHRLCSRGRAFRFSRAIYDHGSTIEGDEGHAPAVRDLWPGAPVPACRECVRAAGGGRRLYALGVPPQKERWLAHWAHLYDEVVTSGLCTGCAGCVVACPHDVLGYDDTNGVYKPFQLELDGGPGGCGHGDRGCTSCTRACPRFRAWEPELDTFLFGRERRPDEIDGVSKDIILARVTDPQVLEKGQDGGLVSAMLLWCIEHGYIDAALVSYLEGDGSTWKAIPGVARTREEILASAGSPT